VNLQRSLFTKDDDIILKDVLSIARARETAEASTSLIRGEHSSSTQEQTYVNKVNSGGHSKNQAHHQDGITTYQKKQNMKSKSCPNCGSRDHVKSRDCPQKDIICYACGKKGHFAKLCRSSQNANLVDVDSIKSVYSASQKREQAVLFKVEINGIPHVMELDTGCEKSLLSKTFWREQLHSPTL